MTQAFAQHPVTVLLVDDQPIIGEAIRRMLADETDIRFHFCQDPAEALATARTIFPTVILQDLVMPGTDGMTLVRQYRTDPLTRAVPLIVLSSKEDPTVKAEAFAAGVNDYLVKLPNRIELVARIRYHSAGYIGMLERNEAYEALVQSQRQLEIRNKFIRETFGRYLADEVVASILETPGGLNLGGEKRKVTILMSDLRGFTTLSERLAPEQVVSLLNGYLEAMTDVIMAHGGTIDDIIGDGMLVIFGAPVIRGDESRRAIACALSMQLAMTQVNSSARARQLPVVEMGIGVHTGEVVAGNIGSPKRAKYSIVGSPVNLASRIESCTIGGQILISSDTLEDAGEDVVEVTRRFEVAPKGVKAPLTLYEVVGLAAGYDLKLPPRLDGPRTKLAEPVPIACTILDGKLAGDVVVTGRLLGLSATEVEIATDRPLRGLTDLRVQILREDGAHLHGPFYGKLLPRPSDAPADLAVVRFTQLPEDVAEFLRACRDAQASG